MPSKKDFGKADAWLTEHHDTLAKEHAGQHFCIDAVTLVYTVGDTYLGQSKSKAPSATAAISSLSHSLPAPRLTRGFSFKNYCTWLEVAASRKRSGINSSP